MTFATVQDYRDAIGKLQELIDICNRNALCPESWPLAGLYRLQTRFENLLRSKEEHLHQSQERSK